MENTNKAVVGIFVAACLLLFGIGLFLIGDSNQLFTKSFDVYADFAKITGIQLGGKVRVAGMDAGTVTAIDVPSHPEDKFRVYFRIMERLHPIVRQDSLVTIQTDGLLGNKYLLVDAGTSSSSLAKDHSLIRSTEPFDWGDLMEEVRTSITQINQILLGVREQLTSTLREIESTFTSVTSAVKQSSPQVRTILLSADRISTNLTEILDGIQQGEGTVGALFKDKELSASLRRSVDNTESAIANLRDTTGSAKRIVGDVQASNIIPEMQQAMANMKDVTRQVKDAMEKFQSATEEGGVAQNLQRTLADAQEAMSDLSDNTEALKHNFFFRGFFNRRGFFDLESLTAAEYRDPKFGKGFRRSSVWLADATLFDTDANGGETLSASGKLALDETMTRMLVNPRNGPLMIEGYAATGSAAQRYLLARRRAASVQAYLIGRFHLRPAYVGVVSMTTEASGTADPALLREGVGIVSFYKK